MILETNVLFILAVSFLVTFMATPIVKQIAQRFGVVDVPKDNRRMHKKAMPLMGGLAMFYGFLVSIAVFVPYSRPLLGLLLGSLLIVIVGIVDDKKNLHPLPKLFFQIIAAGVAVYFGHSIKFFSIPFSSGDAPFVVASPYAEIISVVWIVGMTNAVNFIDGLDGLAAGVSSIASLSILFISIIIGNVSVTPLAAALVGCCVGFLPFNSNPAKIFMGDTGSTFLGYVLSVISIQGLFKGYALISFVLPVFVLGLPLFDTLFAIVRRILSGKSIMSADRGHLHHRLIDMGLNQRQAVAILYSISSLLGIGAVVMAARGVAQGIILMISVLPILIAAIVIAARREQEINKSSDESSEGGPNEKA